MALKQFFTELINANWGDITSPPRVPIKDREVGSEIVNELYSPTITDNQNTTNIFARGTIQTNFDYNFILKKRGNIVFISGRVANNSPATSNVLAGLCEIINPEFYPSVNQNILGSTNSSQRVTISVVDNLEFKGILCNFISIPPSGSFNFNGFYFTND